VYVLCVIVIVDAI